MSILVSILKSRRFSTSAISLFKYLLLPSRVNYMYTFALLPNSEYSYW